MSKKDLETIKLAEFQQPTDAATSLRSPMD